MKAYLTLTAAPLALVLAACSQSPSEEPAPAATASATPVEPTAPATPASQPGTADAKVLRLEGLGDLVIGAAVPAGSSFGERGAQASDSCRTVSSPDYPGVYAIIERGAVRRITVAGSSDVKLVEGVGIGSSEDEVLAAFPGFVSEPHKYVEAPAKYLTQPGTEPRLRFEIDGKGKVSDIHVGEAPQLLYVEGCA